MCVINPASGECVCVCVCVKAKQKVRVRHAAPVWGALLCDLRAQGAFSLFILDTWALRKASDLKEQRQRNVSGAGNPNRLCHLSIHTDSSDGSGQPRRSDWSSFIPTAGILIVPIHRWDMETQRWRNLSKATQPDLGGKLTRFSLTRIRVKFMLSDEHRSAWHTVGSVWVLVALWNGDEWVCGPWLCWLDGKRLWNSLRIRRFFYYLEREDQKKKKGEKSRGFWVPWKTGEEILQMAGREKVKWTSERRVTPSGDSKGC